VIPPTNLFKTIGNLFVQPSNLFKRPNNLLNLPTAFLKLQAPTNVLRKNCRTKFRKFDTKLYPVLRDSMVASLIFNIYAFK